VTAQEAPRDTPDVQLEIVLRNGRRLLAPSSVDPEVLARLLPALEGR
jgi:transposase